MRAVPSKSFTGCSLKMSYCFIFEKGPNFLPNSTISRKGPKLLPNSASFQNGPNLLPNIASSQKYEPVNSLSAVTCFREVTSFETCFALGGRLCFLFTLWTQCYTKIFIEIKLEPWNLCAYRFVSLYCFLFVWHKNP